MKKNPENLSKIIIPNNPNLPGNKEELLENLKNISHEELENFWNAAYLNWLVNKLKKGNCENLGKSDAMILINSDNIDIFFDNVDKFKWLDLEVATMLIDKKRCIKRILSYFKKKDRKAIALRAIKAGNTDIYIDPLPLTDRNLDFAKQMIENGFDPKKLGKLLNSFQEKDRKDIALIAIKAGSNNIYLHSIPLKDRNLVFVNQMIENGFDPQKLGSILGIFQEKDRKDIALITIKAGGRIFLSNLLPEDLDDELANAMIDAGFKDDVKMNKKRFNLKLRTKIRLW